jgi:hypothetical protein
VQQALNLESLILAFRGDGELSAGEGRQRHGIPHVWPAMMIASWPRLGASLVGTAASAAAAAAGRLMRTTQLAGCWTGSASIVSARRLGHMK